MYNTTTKNKKKLEHKAIIHKWRANNAMMLAKGKLKKVHSSTADDMIEKLLNGIREDERSIYNLALSDYIISDGYDIYQEAYSYLLAMNNAGYWQLFKDEDITITMMKGKQKKVTLAQGVGYHTRNYIYKWGQSDFKKTYIEDYSQDDGEGNELNCYDTISNMVEVTRLYDISNYEELEEYKSIDEVVKKHCTERQKLIYHYRKQGYSVGEISKKLGVSSQAISKHLGKIQEIVTEHFPEKVRAFKEKRTAKAK